MSSSSLRNIFLAYSKVFQSCRNFSSSRSYRMDLNAVVAKLESFAPVSLAEQWDNVGLLVEPSGHHTVDSMLLTNDLTEKVLEEAIESEVQMILSYHPPIFIPLKRLTSRSFKERIIVKAIEKRIAIYSPHTAFDAVNGGVNDWLASGLGDGHVTPLFHSMEDSVKGCTCKVVITTTKTLDADNAKDVEMRICCINGIRNLYIDNIPSSSGSCITLCCSNSELPQVIQVIKEKLSSVTYDLIVQPLSKHGKEGKYFFGAFLKPECWELVNLISSHHKARVHPLRRLSVGEEQEMKEVNHNQNIKTRKTSWQQIGQEVKAVSRWKTYKSSMRDHSLEGYINRTAERPRVVHDSCKNLSKKTQLCVLDSDVDNLGEQNFSPYDAFGCLRQSVSHGVTPEEALISSKTMIIYFAKLAKASLEEEQVIDFDFLQELLDEGADINFTDSHGQTVFHEVARIWNVDVAKFMLENGGLVNNADDYGRTPLHVASAVDYPEMIEFLITNQANIHVKTKGEMQTPIHYAAKNDAGQALKMLLKLGANVEDRDYKNRTPLQVAAELDRSDTAKLLIDKGTSAGVQDDSGSCVLSLMISKMPPVAKEALDQFHSADRANRKQYYYLNYLEPYKPPKGGECHAKTPLQCVVSFKQMDLIMHPVFQRLIDVKWQQFGRRGVVLQLLVQLFYVFIWTALAVTLHLREGANFYNPLSKYWWRIVLETIACSMTVYFILQEFLEISASKKAHRKWQHWRIQELQKDLKFCHPRWPEERKYLEMELREISELGISYFNDAWNYFDWVTYGWVLGMIVTRVLDVASITGLHLRISAVGIIFVWLRLMKAFRAFSTLGPFIVMIGHIIDDTLKFAVLFIGFYIPYVCAFWILFGGPENARIMTAAQQPTQGWEDFNDLMYSVWQLTYVGNFPWESLLSVDRLMAQLLCGSYIAVSGIVLLNLFIALMSDTFQRVHDNAKANAAMQRASTILSLEESMSRSGREKHRRYVHQKLAPEELYYDDDSTGPQSGELERMTHQIKEVIDEVLECVQDGGTSSSDTNRRDKPRHSSIMRLQEDLARASELHEDGLNAVRQEMADLKQAINILKLTLQQQQQKHSPLMSGNSQQIFSSQHLTPVKNQAPLSHRKKHKKDQSFPGNEDERYDQVPYEGLPLPTTTTVDQLPSVSAITGRIKRHHR